MGTRKKKKSVQGAHIREVVGATRGVFVHSRPVGMRDAGMRKLAGSGGCMTMEVAIATHPPSLGYSDKDFFFFFF
jgi:hypothetical protein